MPSNGKNLKGKSPNQLWSEEFKVKNVIAKDELKLFCMRTSKTFSITRNGVRDGELDVNYWGEWMVAHKGSKVYLRRDPMAYQEAWIFRADDDEYLGIANIADLVAPALGDEDIEKAELKKVFAMKQREKKLSKAYIKTHFGYDSEENLENYKASFDQIDYEDNSKVSKIARTKMSDAILKEKANKQADTTRYSDYVSNLPEKKQIFLYESEKRRYAREANV